MRPTLFARNFVMKVFSLAVSLLIFAFVRCESTTAIDVDFPIDYELADNIIITGDHPTVVHATLEGPWASLRSFERSELRPVAVDLEHEKVGEPISKRLTTDDIKPPMGVQVVSIRNAEITLTLDRKIVRTVPVEVDIVDRPPTGFEIHDVKTEPKEVRIEGPSSRVSTIDFVWTKGINLSTNQDEVTIKRELKAPAGVGAVRLLDKEVTVIVEIVETFVERTLSDVVVGIDNAPKGTRATPAKVTISIRGPLRVLSNLDPKSVEVYVDAEPEVDEGRRSVEKAVSLRAAPERTVLVGPIPNVVIQLPKTIRRRKR